MINTSSCDIVSNSLTHTTHTTHTMEYLADLNLHILTAGWYCNWYHNCKVGGYHRQQKTKI